MFKNNKYQLQAVILLIFLTVMSSDSLYAQLDMGLTPMDNTVKRDKKHQFAIFKEENPAQLTRHAQAVFELTPPLRPERLARRAKMLWGLDLNDYPKDCLINLGGDRDFGFYLFNPRTGAIWMKSYQDGIMGDAIPKSFPPDKYALAYRYMMMDDTEALRENYNKYDYQETEENPFPIDFITDEWSYADFDARKSMLKYRDHLRKSSLEPSITNRAQDVVLLFTQQEMKKGRKLYISPGDQWSSEVKVPDNEIYIQKDPFYTSYKDQTCLSDLLNFFTYRSGRNNPWYPMLTGESVTAAWLSFQLCLKVDSVNNKIVRELNRKYSDYDLQNKIDNFKKSLKDNNYYGHAVLREFLTNPMREMPTLGKIGSGFKAKIKEDNTPLLLEPVSVSYDIDTIYRDETFTAYEMGHDNYYFIEIEKPVESPIADKDGYAMIIDRKETVYGYLPKKQVEAYNSEDMLNDNRYKDTSLSAWGIINDKDGYVNIRKANNTQSEIVGKIMDNETFHYWKTNNNWYIVETINGIRGFVYKDRITERYQEKEQEKRINLPNENDGIPEI